MRDDGIAGMVTLQGVVVDALWLIGLAALLATAGYLGWSRQLNGWQWRHILQTPRSRMSVALSLFLIASGAALNGLTDRRHDPGWAVMAWLLLSFLLFIQFIQAVFAARAGDQHGWDSATEGNHRP